MTGRKPRKEPWQVEQERIEREKQEALAQRIKTESEGALAVFRQFHRTIKAERYRIRCTKGEEGKIKTEDYHRTINSPEGLRASDVYKALPELKQRELEGWQVYIEPLRNDSDFLVMQGVSAEHQEFLEQKKVTLAATIKNESGERTVVVRMRKSAIGARVKAKREVEEFFYKRFGAKGEKQSQWITFPGFLQNGKNAEFIPGSEYGCQIVDGIRAQFETKILTEENDRRLRLKAALKRLDGVGKQLVAHCLDILKRRKGRQLGIDRFDRILALRLRAMGRTKEEILRGLISVLPLVTPSVEKGVIEQRAEAAVEAAYSARYQGYARRLTNHRERYQRMELELVRNFDKGLQR